MENFHEKYKPEEEDVSGDEEEEEDTNRSEEGGDESGSSEEIESGESDGTDDEMYTHDEVRAILKFHREEDKASSDSEE